MPLRRSGTHPSLTSHFERKAMGAALPQMVIPLEWKLAESGILPSGYVSGVTRKRPQPD